MSARSLAPNAARLSKYPGRASGSLNWDCAAVVHWRGGRADACLTTRSYVAVGSRLIGPDVAGSYSPEAGTQLCGMGTGSGQAGTTSARQGPKRDVMMIIPRNSGVAGRRTLYRNTPVSLSS